MGVAYWVVMWAWLTEGVWFCVMGVAYVGTAYVGGAYGGDVAYDWAWPMWAWLMEEAWFVIALGLCGRGLWKGCGLLDVDYMSVACDWT